MTNLFTHHPQKVGESYCQHFCYAFSHGCRMVLAGLACIIHAFLPFLFETKGSDTILIMAKDMQARRHSMKD